MKQFTPALLLLVALTGCAPTALVAPDEPRGVTPLTARPTGSPDAIVFAVSGRCRMLCRTAPDDNHEYLTGRGTVGVVTEALRRRGLRVSTYAYSAHLDATHFSNLSGRQEPGFLQLEQDFRELRDTLVRGRSNPPLLVLVGHSHGTNWVRNLVRLNPSTTFDLVVDLDGVCALWETDNRGSFDRLYATRGNPWPIDLRGTCRPVTVARRTVHVKDIAFPNVRYNLEVQSQHLVSGSRDSLANFPYDNIPNVRLDGSRGGIQTFVSATENHSVVTRPGSLAMRWVERQLLDLPLGVGSTTPLDKR